MEKHMTDCLPLNEIQVRILGCLIEKKATTPHQYPLTLNALKTACNQKTNRFPVVNYDPGTVGHEVRVLEGNGALRMERGSRVERYQHQLDSALAIRARDIAVLSTLMLRGPQTIAEIKARTYAVLGMEDTDAIREVVERLINRDPPLVCLVPRQPGQKEDRYTHLLAGEPDFSALPQQSTARSVGGVHADLCDRVARLEAELMEMKSQLERWLQGQD